MKAEHKAKMDALDAELIATRKQRTDTKVAAALHAELVSAGVAQGLQAAAIAVLREEATFEVEGADDGEGDVVVATTRDGFLQSPEMLVAGLLDSDDGAPFRGRRTAPSDGMFSNLIAELKQRR